MNDHINYSVLRVYLILGVLLFVVLMAVTAHGVGYFIRAGVALLMSVLFMLVVRRRRV